MRFALLFCVATFLGHAILLAQEPPLPKSDTQDPAIEAPEAKPSTTAAPLSTPAPQLIPPDVLPLHEPNASPPPADSNLLTVPQLDEALARSPANAAAADTRRQAEWRQLRNRVANDADLKEKLRMAEAAPTDLQKRRLLGRYYKAYFGRMIALAATPELKAYLEAKKTEQLNALPQPRTRPEPSPSAKAKG